MTTETKTNTAHQLITTHQLAAMWHCSDVSLINARSQGKSLIPWYKIGSSVRYKLADAVAFIENQHA